MFPLRRHNSNYLCKPSFLILSSSHRIGPFNWQTHTSLRSVTHRCMVSQRRATHVKHARHDAATQRTGVSPSGARCTFASRLLAHKSPILWDEIRTRHNTCDFSLRHTLSVFSQKLHNKFVFCVQQSKLTVPIMHICIYSLLCMR